MASFSVKAKGGREYIYICYLHREQLSITSFSMAIYIQGRLKGGGGKSGNCPGPQILGGP